MDELRIGYVFRRPRFPVLCVLGEILIAARTRQQLQRQLQRQPVPSNQMLPVIDASGEGWGLHTDLMAMSPMVMKKRWTKSELVKLYRRNVGVAQAEVNGKVEVAWLRLRLDDVVSTIVVFVEQGTPNPRLQPDPRDRTDARKQSGGR